MDALLRMARWGSCAFLAISFLAVFWSILTDRSLQGLLSGDRYDLEASSLVTDQFTAGRAQSLIFVLYFAVYYLIQIAHSSSGFPPVPKWMLYVLGGSQGIYLSGKTYDLVLTRVLDNFRKGSSR
jgi:hypothetical protein